MTNKKEHITIFLHYNISWNNKPKLYISVIYILHTDTVKQTISWNNKSDHCDRKTKTLALPYREPHQRTPGCCLNSCKWLTLAFVCAVQLVILGTYSHDSQIHFACALQMFADLCLHPINWRRFHFWTCRPHTESRDLCMPLRSTSFQFSLYIYIYAFSRRFYPKRLTVHSGYTFFCQYVSMGIEPTTFALLTQCSNHWATGTHSSLQISHGYDCFQ